jgi:hypothetical protein
MWWVILMCMLLIDCGAGMRTMGLENVGRGGVDE